MKAARFDVSREISAPCEDAWDLLTDTRKWSSWGPSVRQVECSRRYIGPGVTGRVKTPFGVWLPFTVSEYRHPLRWSWRVGGLPATGHRVEKGAGGGCRVVFEVPCLAFPYGLVCLVAAGRIARILEG